MLENTIAVFTSETLRTLLLQGGTQRWHLNRRRARRCSFLICVQNRRSAEFLEPGAEHGKAFLLAPVHGIEPAPKDHNKLIILFDEFCEIDIPHDWSQRNPVKYAALRDFGLDPERLPPFQPVPRLPPTGMAEAQKSLTLHPPLWTPQDPDAWRRVEAILAQLDRIPDAPAPFQPLAWDELGLPR